jgi:CheY-like chemotaxis protein
MGRGTGLGLASAYGIVAGHGGAIDVVSEPDRGTVFSVYLPATDRPVSCPVVDEPQISAGQGTVLFVDDEAMVLEVGAEMLRSLGYRVITAAGGSEALDRFQTHREEIDLVVLDMVMPGMNGAQVFDRLQALDPEVVVVLATGYSIDGKMADLLTRGCRGVLQKPYTLAQLSERLESARGVAPR